MTRGFNGGKDRRRVYVARLTRWQAGAQQAAPLPSTYVLGNIGGGDGMPCGYGAAESRATKRDNGIGKKRSTGRIACATHD